MLDSWFARVHNACILNKKVRTFNAKSNTDKIDTSKITSN